jgi:hypothetical protein
MEASGFFGHGTNSDRLVGPYTRGVSHVYWYIDTVQHMLDTWRKGRETY